MFKCCLVYLYVTRANQMTSLLLLNHFCPVIYHTDVFKRERKRQIIAYGSVARYGPRNQLPAQEVNSFRCQHSVEISDAVAIKFSRNLHREQQNFSVQRALLRNYIEIKSKHWFALRQTNIIYLFVFCVELFVGRNASFDDNEDRQVKR